MNRSECSEKFPSRSHLLLLWSFFALLLPNASVFAQVVSLSALPQPPERIVVDKNNVDVTSGAVTYSHRELSIGSEQYGLQLTTFYNSQSGWRNSFSSELVMHTFGEWNGELELTASWGNKSWTFQSDNGYSRSGDGASISTWGGGYIVTTRDGTVITYSHLGLNYFPCPGDGSIDCYQYFFATQVAYPNGLIVTPHYRVFVGSDWSSWAVRIQSVTNNAGYQIKFTYKSDSISESSDKGLWLTRSGAVAVNRAVEYCDPDADTCVLTGSWPAVTYDTAPGTHTATDSLQHVTRYTYGTTFFRIKTAGSSSDNIEYTLAYFVDNAQTGALVRRVTSAKFGADTWGYSYGTGTTAVADPQHHETVFTVSKGLLPDNFFGYWEVRTLDSMEAPLGRVTSFDYPCTGGIPDSYLNSNVYKVTADEGNSSTPACDSRGNVKSITLQPKAGSGLANVVTHSDFPVDCINPKTCNKPTATYDGRGAEADYEYYPTHGGIWTETLPPVPVCSPDGTQCSYVRPKRTYEYDQLSAYVINASQTLVQESTPVWLPTKIRECRTSASCAGGADELVTSFEYGAPGTVNRLLVRGKVVTANGVSHRTCYSYDNFGNQISVTTPRADLTACP